MFTTAYGRNDQTGRYLETEGIRLYFEEYGSGPPLLLIHGNGSCIAGMGFQIEYFRKTHRVIIADSRGHGKSDLGSVPLIYEQIAADLLALLNFLGLKKISIFGWSDGGIVGLMMAIRESERIDKLAIFGANTKPSGHALVKMENQMLERALEETGRLIREGNPTEFRKRKWQQLLLLKDQPDISWDDLGKISSRVLVMAGEKDTVRESHTLEIFRHLPNAELHIFPGETHFLPVEKPDKLNRKLKEFFE